MSSTITHAVANSLAAALLVNIQPNETAYLLAGVVSASIIDMDHVVMVIKNRQLFQKIGLRGNLHLARSVFHELFGLVFIGILAASIYWIDPKLANIVFIAFTLHLVQDWLLGISFPFNPIDHTEVHFLNLTFKQKAAIEFILVTLSGVLWLIYLSGHLLQ
jgi:hypothetical protein